MKTDSRTSRNPNAILLFGFKYSGGVGHQMDEVCGMRLLLYTSKFCLNRQSCPVCS
jgi:uncharacterized ferredoxin-like protein